MERPRLHAQRRTERGSRSARRTRHAGLIPGIVYGKAMEPVPVVVNRQEFVKLLHAGMGEHGLLTLRIEGGGSPWERPVLIKDAEHDPVRSGIRHLDFHAITLTERIRVKVPIALKGEAVGVKQDGGVLEHFLRELEVECLPTDIPKQVDYDISAMNIGDAVHVRDLRVADGIKIMAEMDAVVASVLTPKEEKIEEVAPAAEEPEVIREKKPEEAVEGAEGKAERPEKDEKKDKKDKKEEK